MRVERVVLEHHGDVAVGRIDIVDDAVADADHALGDGLEPGDHAQQGRFSAAGRSDQDDEFAIGDVEGDVVHGALCP